MYHKVDIIAPSRWWVPVDRFKQQISFLKKHFDVVCLDNYDCNGEDQAVLTFDDAYENVFNHAFPVLRKYRLPFEVFINGDLLGQWNDFDKVEMKTRYCDISHLKEMSEYGARIQWHTRNHSRLTFLSDDQLDEQVRVSEQLRLEFGEPHFRWFAYPYGLHDERVVNRVKESFVGALSVDRGSESDRFQLNRIVADTDWLGGF